MQQRGDVTLWADNKEWVQGDALLLLQQEQCICAPMSCCQQHLHVVLVSDVCLIFRVFLRVPVPDLDAPAASCSAHPTSAQRNCSSCCCVLSPTLTNANKWYRHVTPCDVNMCVIQPNCYLVTRCTQFWLTDIFNTHPPLDMCITRLMHSAIAAGGAVNAAAASAIGELLTFERQLVSHASKVMVSWMTLHDAVAHYCARCSGTGLGT